MNGSSVEATDRATHVDVLIVGAGLSGIGAGYHLQTNCPAKSYAILEGRESLGGTWDLFRYPGVRSDSDMYTLGFSFRPWTDPKAIADGPSILAYLRETAAMYGIDRRIRYGHKVLAARWSSRDSRWTVDVRKAGTGEALQLTCNFLFMCAGYYNYDDGYTPDFPGRDAFRGRIVHPQHWPQDLDYAGKRVLVIGSGATAMTLVPSLAKTAGHVTMLQRSPTYVVSRPDRDPVADLLRGKVSDETAYAITRWKNVVLGMAFYQYCRRSPERAKKMLVGWVRRQVRDDGQLAHFTPTYKPWDQRLCLVPNGDLFRALHKGRASVVTDHIDRFVENGVRLRSGGILEADIIVTATGLNLQFLGGLTLDVDGHRVELPKTMTYKGMMISDVPNMALAVGYTNASWTLKCDLTAQYVCRLLNHMDKHGYTQCCPRRDASVKEAPFIDFTSGYIQRSIANFPRQGSTLPWRVYQNYAVDRMMLKHQSVRDGAMKFSGSAR
jgi:monooxygenase